MSSSNNNFDGYVLVVLAVITMCVSAVFIGDCISEQFSQITQAMAEATNNIQ